MRTAHLSVCLALVALAGVASAATRFAQTFGSKAFRRPLETAEVSNLMKVYTQGTMQDFNTAIGLRGNYVHVKTEGCIGCGVCQNRCPTTPKSIVVRPRKG